MQNHIDEIPNSISSEGRSPLIPIVNILALWRRFIILCSLVCLIASTIVAFLIRPQFKSIASVFPAEKADLFGAIEGVSSLVRNLSPRGLSALGGNVELDRYLAILRSGRMLSQVVDRFDLVNVYDFSSASYALEKTTKRLIDNIDFSVEPEGTLKITVYDEDPDRAADIANYFVEHLNIINSELQAQNARGNREFIEERYHKNLSDLASAEDSLRIFQKKFGVIAVPQQAEASIKASSELAAQLTLREVALSVLLRTQSSDYPSVVAAKFEIEELKRKINEMSEGDPVSQGSMNILIPLRRLPDYGAEYLRRFREVEIQYKILQFITPLYEQAKVEEKRVTPSVIVLDQAVPAERKSKPKRSLIMLGGFMVGFVFSLGWVAVAERWRAERERSSSLYLAIRSLWVSLRSDITALFARKNRS